MHTHNVPYLDGCGVWHRRPWFIWFCTPEIQKKNIDSTGRGRHAEKSEETLQAYPKSKWTKLRLRQWKFMTWTTRKVIQFMDYQCPRKESQYDFSDTTAKAWSEKERIAQLGFIKIESFCPEKDNSREWEDSSCTLPASDCHVFLRSPCFVLTGKWHFKWDLVARGAPCCWCGHWFSAFSDNRTTFTWKD